MKLKHFFFNLCAPLLLAQVLVGDATAQKQTNIGPVTSPHVNANFYVGVSPYTTIQSAVTAACAGGAGNGNVILQPGAAPADTIAAATGCAGVYITDARAASVVVYNWTGGKYILNAGGTVAAAISVPKFYYALGDSITCGYIAGSALGPAGSSSCSTSFAYPSIVAADTGLALTNTGYPGDTACDVWPRAVAGFSLAPTITVPSVSSIIIGSNDANLSHAGPYEATFNLCHSAVVAYMAVPLETKSLAASATLGTGWTQQTNGTIGNYITSSTAASTATFTLTTYGGPVFLWYVIQNSTGGALTYAIDSGTPVSVSVLANPAIHSALSVPTVALATATAPSGTPAVPVTHTITVTNTSGTTPVVGVGTPPGNKYLSRPIEIISDVPNVGPGGPLAPADQAAYSADVTATAKQMASYNLDVRFISNHTYLTGSVLEFQTDEQHPNHLGAIHLAQPIEQAMQPVYVPTQPTTVLTGNYVSGSSTTVIGNASPSTASTDTSPGVAIAYPTPLPAGVLSSFQLNFMNSSHAGQALTMYLFNKSGSTISVAQQFSITVKSGVGVQTYTGGTDYTAPTATAGQLFGYYGASSGPSYSQTDTSNPYFLYYLGAPPTSATWTTAASTQGTIFLQATIAGAGNSVSMPGMTSTGHCNLSPTNTSAAANFNVTYIASKSANTVSMATTGPNGMTFDLVCTTQ
jgi:lysophospholipase L1-like esterase